MLAIVFALSAALTLGISDFYGTLAARKIGAVITTALAYTAATVIIALALPFIPGEWSLTAGVTGAIAGVFIGVGFLAFYAAMAMGPVSVVAPLIAVMYAAVPVIWAVGRGETLSGVSWGGVALGVLAVLALSIGPKGGSESEAELAADAAAGRPPGVSALALVLSIVSALGLGGATIALDAAPKDAGVIPALVESIFAVLVAMVVLAFVRRPGKGELGRNPVWVALISGLLMGVGNAAFLLALQVGQLAVVSVLVALYPLSTILLARIVLREHVSRIQWGGVALAVAAAVLMGVG